MPIFLLKSILALGLMVLTLVGLFTMFEIYGRTEKRFNVSTLMRIHRVNGFLYLALFLIISHFCLKFLIATRTDLSPRSTMHVALALTIFVLLCFKIAVVSAYRGFYGKLQQVGPLLALATFLLIGTSAGYYLLVTDLGREKGVAGMLEGGGPQGKAATPAPVTASSDPATIARGEALFREKCTPCHFPDSTKTLVGPGLKGVLKGPVLPRSGRPATPGAILNQLRNPYMLMPSFSYLTDDDALSIVAFVNTL